MKTLQGLLDNLDSVLIKLMSQITSDLEFEQEEIVGPFRHWEEKK